MKTILFQFLCCALLVVVIALLAGCGGGDDCEAGTGTFKPLPEDCKDKAK